MFRAAREFAPLSTESSSSEASFYHSKLLITRRSWRATSTWSKFPSIVSESITDFGIGDYVDSSTRVPGQTTEFVPSTYGDRQTLKEFLRVHGFQPYQLLFFIISVLTYVSDIGSDAYLVYSYYQNADYYWSGLTLALLIVPALVMTAFSLTWYVLDHKVRMDHRRTCRAWTLRLFFHGLQLAPLVRLADALYYGLASRRPGISVSMAVQYTQLMLYEGADSAMLRMIECFMEAAPQLILQLYIVMTQDPPVHAFQITAQAVSCTTSWLSLAWSLAHYQSALRSSRVEKANLSWKASVLYYFWKSGMLSSRILSLALFAAAVREPWFAFALVAHWILTSGWLMARGTTFCSPVPHTLTEFGFDLVIGAVYLFDVVNICEGHSRLLYTACYSIIGMENLFMLFTWFLYSHTGNSDLRNTFKWLLRTANPSWINRLPFWTFALVVIGSFILGLSFMLLYYLTAHPSKNIKICLPCGALIGSSIPKDRPLVEEPIKSTKELEVPIMLERPSSKGSNLWNSKVEFPASQA